MKQDVFLPTILNILEQETEALVIVSIESDLVRCAYEFVLEGATVEQNRITMYGNDHELTINKDVVSVEYDETVDEYLLINVSTGKEFGMFSILEING